MVTNKTTLLCIFLLYTSSLNVSIVVSYFREVFYVTAYVIYKSVIPLINQMANEQYNGYSLTCTAVKLASMHVITGY